MGSRRSTLPLLTDLLAAREHALSVLEQLRSRQDVDASAGDAMVALQEAANKLGVAEALFSAPAEGPAPFVDPDDPSSLPEAVAWSGEAAAVMALAEFTVPLAGDRADQAGRWFRALRREGAVGRALGDLGFPDGELTERAEPPAPAASREAVETVRAKAALLARHRCAGAVTTVDVLFAVLTTYGGLADRALYERGITRPALLERVTMGAADTLRR